MNSKRSIVAQNHYPRRRCELHDGARNQEKRKALKVLRLKPDAPSSLLAHFDIARIDRVA
jgi:hypothetical protein